jgi:hypothetical protein
MIQNGLHGLVLRSSSDEETESQCTEGAARDQEGPTDFKNGESTCFTIPLMYSFHSLGLDEWYELVWVIITYITRAGSFLLLGHLSCYKESRENTTFCQWTTTRTQVLCKTMDSLKRITPIYLVTKRAYKASSYKIHIHPLPTTGRGSMLSGVCWRCTRWKAYDCLDI